MYECYVYVCMDAASNSLLGSLCLSDYSRTSLFAIIFDLFLSA